MLPGVVYVSAPQTVDEREEMEVEEEEEVVAEKVAAAPMLRRSSSNPASPSLSILLETDDVCYLCGMHGLAHCYLCGMHGLAHLVGLVHKPSVHCAAHLDRNTSKHALRRPRPCIPC